MKTRSKTAKAETGAKLSVKNRGLHTLRERLERHAEAVTFAEAGLHDHAREVLAAERRERAKVLVVGDRHTFSRALVDYSVGFAERMGYEVVALNVSPVPHESTTDEELHQAVCGDFACKCHRGVNQFQAACQEKNIPFSHLVKFGDTHQAIKKAHEDMRRVEFVVSEPDRQRKDGRSSINVFSIAH